MNYIVPFWIVFTVSCLVVAILIYLSVLKSQDNKMIHLGYVGLRFMVEQHLSLLLQKVVYLLLRYDNYQAKKGMDIRLVVVRDTWIKNHALELTKGLLSFSRAKDVANHMYLQNQLPFQQMDLYTFPDVLITRNHVDLYKNLLVSASTIVSDQAQGFEKYTNDESKQYLIALESKTKISVPLGNGKEPTIVYHQ